MTLKYVNHHTKVRPQRDPLSHFSTQLNEY